MNAPQKNLLQLIHSHKPNKGRMMFDTILDLWGGDAEHLRTLLKSLEDSGLITLSESAQGIIGVSKVTGVGETLLQR